MLCSLLEESEAGTSSQPTAESVPEDVPDVPTSEEAFKGSDFALFYHFTTATAKLMASTSDAKSPFVQLIPELAPQRPYLLHQVLAVAALHLSHLHPSQHNEYLRLASEHHSKALGLYRVALQDEPPGDAVSLFGCSALFVNFYFALPGDPASLLFNAETSGPPDWMYPIRGTRAIWLKNTKELTDGPMSGYVHAHTDPWKQVGAVRESPGSPAILEMREKLWIPPEDEYIFDHAIDELLRGYSVSFRGDPESRKSAPVTFAANVTTGFLDRLGHQDQSALVVMSFWCVLMHRVPLFAWLKNGKAAEMLEVIKAILTPKNLELIYWPIQQIEESTAA
ncbi:hypothetical protein GQ53DRAFT_440346 [Thozetella sp. PMI_491]|nr:hypothetical protein GQ53DRAFT_440346 [Thozetella sp. PMI_491]